jgi:deferrochelatase/peroxidase EfeB
MKKTNEAENEVTRKTTTGQSLVVIKQKTVEEAFAALQVKLRKAGNKTVVRSQAGYSAGQAAGDRINLNRAVANNGNGVLALQ